MDSTLLTSSDDRKYNISKTNAKVIPGYMLRTK